MFDGEEYSASEFAESYGCMKKKKSKNKKRFSDEQIKSLETMFENETRLEPRKKVELAKELGLQPRQVAIWFQNKRARWKSKQLERDYSILRANYNSLASRFESLKKEKQSLVSQLQKLNEQIQNPREERQCSEQGVGGHSSEGEAENGDNNNESEGKPSVSFERSEHGGLGVLSDEDSSIKPEYFGLEEEPDLMSIAVRSLTPQEDWGGFESDGLFEQPSSGYQWWDFWA